MDESFTSRVCSSATHSSLPAVYFSRYKCAFHVILNSVLIAFASGIFYSMQRTICYVDSKRCLAHAELMSGRKDG